MDEQVAALSQAFASMTDGNGPIPGTFLDRVLRSDNDDTDRELVEFVKELIGGDEAAADDAMPRYSVALEMAQDVVEVRDREIG